MPDIEIGYKGSTIASMNSSGILTLSTAGKYCEDNITIDYIRPAMQVVETLDPNGGTIVTITGDVVKDGWETAPEELAQQLVERTISGSVYGSMVLSLKNYAFAYCSSITNASFPGCIEVGTAAFYNCSNLTDVYLPNCTYIGQSTFQGCTKLTSISLPKCISTYFSAFYGCSSLTTVNLQNCSYIGASGFQNCYNLVNISFPVCRYLGPQTFQGCSKLTTVNFPNCTSIGNSTFYNCIKLSIVSFPICTSIGSSAFYGCSSLTTLSFSQMGSKIEGYAFYNCTKLSQIYLMGNSIPALQATAFNNTPMINSTYLGYYGSIYVPASLLTSYKTATNWATLSNRIVGV